MKQSLPADSKPRVSVVMCAYNVASYIEEALDSLFGQTFCDYEVIVVNDGSTDQTAQILQRYVNRIIYIEQPNQGPAAARNAALRIARGEYIAILDSDDVWLPNYLEKMVGFLQENPEIDLYYPNALLFGDSHLAGKTYHHICPSSQPFSLEKFLTQECNVFGLVTFRASILKEVGLYDEGLRGVEDLDLWLRMLGQGYRFAFTDEVLVKYRRHPVSLSSSSVGYYEQVIKCLHKFQASSFTTPLQRELAENYRRKVEAERDLLLAKKEILAGNQSLAINYINKVIAIRPSWKLKITLLGLRRFPKSFAWIVNKYATAPPPMNDKAKSDDRQSNNRSCSQLETEYKF